MLALSFALDYAVAGLAPWIYHLHSALWHAAAAALVVLVAYRFTRRTDAALVGGLLWALHPLHTEAVAYVAGRADPMHAALLLGAFWCWMRSIDTGSRRALLWSLALLGAALLSKERAVMFVILPPLYLLWCLRSAPRFAWRAILIRHARPYVLVVSVIAVYVVLRMTALSFADTFAPGAANTIGATAWWHYALAYLQGVAIYTRDSCGRRRSRWNA